MEKHADGSDPLQLTFELGCERHAGRPDGEMDCLRLSQRPRLDIPGRLEGRTNVLALIPIRERGAQLA